MDDLISRKALMKEFSDFVRESNNSDFAQTPTWNDAVSLVGSMPSAYPEKCTDKRTETHACENTCEIERKLNDMISRADALSCFHDWIDAHGDVHTADEMPEYQRIEQLPSAQLDLSEYSDKLWRNAYERGKRDALAERKTGRWIFGHTLGHSWMKCSECLVSQDGQTACFSYCPNCGAMMVNGGEEHD